MTAPSPRRPWWKMKRWRLALAAWLLVGYPVSYWPTMYLYGRGTINEPGPVNDVLSVFYWPLGLILFGSGDSPRGGLGWFDDAGLYFYGLGEEQAASD